jgi:hypothetical protein
VGGKPALHDLRMDGEMVPNSQRTYEFISTFMRIHFYTYGADVDVYFYPRSGRPDDQLLEKGLRWAAYSPTEAGKLGLSGDRITQIKALLDNRIEGLDSDDMKAKERMPWVRAYKAWSNARDDVDRAQIEQQMAFAAQDFSTRWKKEIEARFTILRSLLDNKQLEDVKKLGKRSGASYD